MGLDVNKYEAQIRAILEAPGVDLRTISAKRVRKQLLEQNGELTPELVKSYKDEIDGLIGQVFEEVSADAGGVDAEVLEEPPKRKREEEQISGAPKKPKKESKREQKLSDADLARQLQQELNGRERGTRAASTTKPKAKRAKKAKSAATIDSDGEGTVDGQEPKKRRGGFSKEYLLSEPLAALLAVDKLSRPQVVKHIWDYIKQNNLQNPADKREIVCDDRLRSVFHVDKIGMFKMNKQLGDHLFEPNAAA